MQADIFHLPAEMTGAFDMVFEHTCYCAISPSRRNELVRVWRRVLTEGGHVLGVFFTMDRPNGPPYGGSEWELRSRLGKTFRLLFWTRLRDSVSSRLGQELLVYAQKIPALR
jgi:SAM-dependent methyltransferase